MNRKKYVYFENDTYTKYKQNPIFIVYLYHARISEFAIILKYMMKNNYLP
jgi:hypothetical protein